MERIASQEFYNLEPFGEVEDLIEEMFEDLEVCDFGISCMYCPNSENCNLG